MKLVNCNRQLSMELKNGEAFFLIMESERALRELVNELFLSVREDTEDWILSEGEEIEKKSFRMEIIFSPWMVDLNNKKIQKGLLKRILKLLQQGVEMDRAQSILEELRVLLDHLNDELAFGFEYELEDVSEILKECGICFPEEGDLLARLNQYIKICSELLNIRLFVFIGMRNYFTGDEISMLAMEAGYLGCSILCIENMCSGAEKDMILIDKDLCRVV